MNSFCNSSRPRVISRELFSVTADFMSAGVVATIDKVVSVGKERKFLALTGRILKLKLYFDFLRYSRDSKLAGNQSEVFGYQILSGQFLTRVF